MNAMNLNQGLKVPVFMKMVFFFGGGAAAMLEGPLSFHL